MLTSRASQTDQPGSSRWSYLRRINPLLKIILCLVLTSFALGLHERGALSLLAGVQLLILLVSVRINVKVLIYGVIATLVFTLLSAWVRDLNTAILSTLRLIAILLPTPLLAGTTSSGDLVRALQTVRLPGFLILSLMLIWRFLPLIQQEAQRIIEANQLRGVDLARQPKYWFGGVVMPLIFRIVAYADDVTIGLETRGYDPTAPRSLGQPLRWRVVDALTVAGAGVLLVTVGYLEWIA